MSNKQQLWSDSKLYDLRLYLNKTEVKFNLRVLLAICRPSHCTVMSSIVVVGVSVSNHSQMRTGKCTCLIFGVSIGLDAG